MRKTCHQRNFRYGEGRVCEQRMSVTMSAMKQTPIMQKAARGLRKTGVFRFQISSWRKITPATLSWGLAAAGMPSMKTVRVSSEGSIFRNIVGERDRLVVICQS